MTIKAEVSLTLGRITLHMSPEEAQELHAEAFEGAPLGSVSDEFGHMLGLAIERYEREQEKEQA